MTAEPDNLAEFNADARRAIRAADVAARALGHDRVGTEHLLLGLVVDDAGGAARMLTDAGTTASAIRNKITEAVGGARRSAMPEGSQLPRTPRANRALGRSVRFARSRHAGVVSSLHLLWGVLDVEGTAGQVLRGLGVDIEQLHTALESPELAKADIGADRPAAPANDAGRAPLVHATCPACSTAIDDGSIVVRVMTARGEGDGAGETDVTRDVLVFACCECHTVLGVAPV